VENVFEAMIFYKQKKKSGIINYYATLTLKESFMTQQLKGKIFYGEVIILESKVIRYNEGIKLLIQTTKNNKISISDHQQVSL
jgi:hypothetical protein